MVPPLEAMCLLSPYAYFSKIYATKGFFSKPSKYIGYLDYRRLAIQIFVTKFDDLLNNFNTL